MDEGDRCAVFLSLKMKACPPVLFVVTMSAGFERKTCRTNCIAVPGRTWADAPSGNGKVKRLVVRVERVGTSQPGWDRAMIGVHVKSTSCGRNAQQSGVRVQVD